MRKHLRAVTSSWQTEDDDDKHGDKSVQLAGEVGEGKFTGYDPDAHYLRASDYNGHSKNIQVTIPTNWAAAVAQIVDDDNLPYRSIVDMARDFIIHGMVRTLMAADQRGVDVHDAWFAEIQLDRTMEIAQAQIRFLEKFEQGCELFSTTGDWGAMLSHLADAEQVELPRNLRRKRDEMVRRFRDKIPEGYQPSWDI